jgi:hypothetical protein
MKRENTRDNRELAKVQMVGFPPSLVQAAGLTLGGGHQGCTELSGVDVVQSGMQDRCRTVADFLFFNCKDMTQRGRMKTYGEIVWMNCASEHDIKA